MWFDLKSSSQFRFKNMSDHARFFDHVSILVRPTDTLVLGCYDAREDIWRFLVRECLSDSQIRYKDQLESNFRHNRSSYPRGAAFHLSGTTTVIETISGFARSTPDSIALCDHVAAYSPERPIFIFHDAFSGGELFVSSYLPKAQVESFSKAVGVDFDVVNVEHGRVTDA